MGLTYSSVVDAPLGEVFAWHARPGAITRLMPPWSPVRLVCRAPQRGDEHAGERYWRPDDPAPDLLTGVDAVIHLAGASARSG